MLSHLLYYNMVASYPRVPRYRTVGYGRRSRRRRISTEVQYGTVRGTAFILDLRMCACLLKWMTVLEQNAVNSSARDLVLFHTSVIANLEHSPMRAIELPTHQFYLLLLLVRKYPRICPHI